MNTKDLVIWINKLKQDKELWRFYKSKWWAGSKDMEGLKNEILREQHCECQECKKLGLIKKADTVHHVQYVSKYPELALSKYYTYKGKQYKNLVAVCKSCHNKLHPEKHKKKDYKPPINKEKW